MHPVQWHVADGKVRATTADELMYEGTVVPGASPSAVVPALRSADAFVLLDYSKRPQGVEKWHPYRNLMRVAPTGDVLWTAELIPGDMWKCFVGVRISGGLLIAQGSASEAVIDPDTGAVLDIRHTK